jgi:hypothetical protein
MTAREFDGSASRNFLLTNVSDRQSNGSHIAKCVKYWAELHLRYPCRHKQNPSVKQFLGKCYGANYLGAIVDDGTSPLATAHHNFNKEPP